MEPFSKSVFKVLIGTLARFYYPDESFLWRARKLFGKITLKIPSTPVQPPAYEYHVSTFHHTSFAVTSPPLVSAHVFRTRPCKAARITVSVETTATVKLCHKEVTIAVMQCGFAVH